MILDSTIKLEAVLAGAITTNQPDVHVDYVDYNPSSIMLKPAFLRTPLNSTTDVTILAAPQVSFIREPVRVSIWNRDTMSVTVSVKTDDGTTEHTIIRATLLTLETLHFERGRGWYSTDANGEIKTA